jgi:hypothetical protein
MSASMDRRDIAGLVDVLDQWRGHRVAIRVVAAENELVTVFSGTLDARSDAKGSSFFWPVDLGASATPRLEQPGIYVHPELVSEVRLHTGAFVLEYAQASTTVNIRLLADHASS